MNALCPRPNYDTDFFMTIPWRHLLMAGFLVCAMGQAAFGDTNQLKIIRGLANSLTNITLSFNKPLETDNRLTSVEDAFNYQVSETDRPATGLLWGNPTVVDLTNVVLVAVFPFGTLI